MMTFTQEEIEKGLNIVELEEDGILLAVESISGSGNSFVLMGKATIEGEVYNNFEIEIETETSQTSAADIMVSGWSFYDYVL